MKDVKKDWSREKRAALIKARGKVVEFRSVWLERFTNVARRTLRFRARAANVHRIFVLRGESDLLDVFENERRSIADYLNRLREQFDISDRASLWVPPHVRDCGEVSVKVTLSTEQRRLDYAEARREAREMGIGGIEHTDDTLGYILRRISGHRYSLKLDQAVGASVVRREIPFTEWVAVEASLPIRLFYLRLAIHRKSTRRRQFEEAWVSRRNVELLGERGQWRLYRERPPEDSEELFAIEMKQREANEAILADPDKLAWSLARQDAMLDVDVDSLTSKQRREFRYAFDIDDLERDAGSSD